jgi:hypothetical protein
VALFSTSVSQDFVFLADSSVKLVSEIVDKTDVAPIPAVSTL